MKNLKQYKNGLIAEEQERIDERVKELKEPKYDEAELDELISKGTKAWAGVSVDELRA